MKIAFFISLISVNALASLNPTAVQKLCADYFGQGESGKICVHAAQSLQAIPACSIFMGSGEWGLDCLEANPSVATISTCAQTYGPTERARDCIVHHAE